MIYFFLLVASVLGQQVAPNGAVLEMTGDAAKIEFGGALTLIHNNTEDQLTCSGKIQASDVLIEGTSTTVADLIGEVAALRQEMTAVKNFVGMMPPPPSPPPAQPPAPASPAIFTYARNGWCTASGGCEFDQYKITSGVTLDECKTWCVAIPECVGLTYESASRCDIHTEDGVAPTLPLGFPGFGHIYTSIGTCGSGPVQITATGSCTSYPCCFALDGRP